MMSPDPDPWKNALVLLEQYFPSAILALLSPNLLDIDMVVALLQQPADYCISGDSSVSDYIIYINIYATKII